MTQSVGGIDRIVRIVRIALGLALIAAAANGNIGVWGYLGLIPLATGLVGWCPPYAMLGRCWASIPAVRRGEPRQNASA